jgi:hypothetical protein
MGLFHSDHDSTEADQAAAHEKVGVLSPSIPIHQSIEADRSMLSIKVVNSTPEHKAKLSHELIAAAASYEVYCKVYPLSY